MLANKFSGGWCDPITEDAQGLAMVLDSNIDRREHTGFLTYLKGKYKKDKISRMEMKYHSPKVLVPSNENT